jgi:hypothetical protein
MDVLVLVAIGALFLLNIAALVLFTRRLLARAEEVRSSLDYNEKHFEPLGDEELPKAARDYFDAVSAELAPLGFEMIGNHRSQVSPSIIVRRFLSRDRSTFAEVLDLTHSWFRRTQALDFASVLSDATYLETADAKLPEVTSYPGHPELLRLLSVPGASARDLYHRHQEFVREHSTSGDSPPLEFKPEDFRGVTNYLHQLFTWQRRLAHGIDSEPPTLATVEDSWSAGAAA